MLLNPTTRLSELRQWVNAPRSTADLDARLIRSIQQSLRVEGYDVAETNIRSSVERILRR